MVLKTPSSSCWRGKSQTQMYQRGNFRRPHFYSRNTKFHKAIVPPFCSEKHRGAWCPYSLPAPRQETAAVPPGSPGTSPGHHQPSQGGGEESSAARSKGIRPLRFPRPPPGTQSREALLRALLRALRRRCIKKGIPWPGLFPGTLGR